MAKIIIIGCPGSGKSTMTFKLKDKLNYPVLHLDQIYHIDNENHITREELVEKVEEFAQANENWIIDGNYVSTVEQRVKLADTIVLLDYDTDLCVSNAIGRTKKERGADMAKGFDNSKIKDEFIEFIKSFKTNTLPRIMAVLENYTDKNIVILKNYDEADRFIESL